MSSPRVILNLARKYNLIALSSIKKRNLYSFRKNDYLLVSPAVQHKIHFSDNAPLKCWNCHFVLKSELFCKKCKVLQEPPENLTYFDIIGIPKNYTVDNSEVHTKFTNLQKQLHPDKFSNKSEKEKEISEMFSTLVNKAYTTLANPLKRGLYMLKLNGISIPEGTTNLNPEFLMEIMEKNEKIEEAKEDTKKILALMQENKEMLDTLTKKVSEAFAKEDTEAAKAVLIKMKYYDSIDSRLKKLKHDLGIVQ